MIKVIVTGIAGRMASHIAEIVRHTKGMQLDGATEAPGSFAVGTTLPEGHQIVDDLAKCIERADVVMQNFRLGVAEQYSFFNTIKRDGEDIGNPADELVNSSITQLLFGYGVTPRFGLQLNLPVIARQFRRLDHQGNIEHGNEDGFGDMSLVGQYLVWSDVRETSVFRFSVLGGVKFPTGDSSRLGEELAEEDEPTAVALRTAARRLRPRHTPDPPPSGGGGGTPQLVSGVHGHDLTLGSGSFDGIIGASVFWSWQRFYVTAATQFAIRSEGDFDYQYANDLIWNAGLGLFPLMGHDLARHDYTLAVRANLSGESKGKDTQNGQQVDDTALTSMFVGPGIDFTWGDSLSIDLVGDLPVLLNNSALQIVPDYRIRGGVTWRF